MLPNRVIDLFTDPVLGGFHLGQLEKREQNCEEYQDDCKEVNVQPDYRVLRCTLSRSSRRFLQNECCTNPGENCRSQRVEGLRPNQTAGGRLWLTQHRNIRISGYLENSDSCCQNH